VDYSWPGNVRELINVMERAVLLCGDEEITLDDLPAPIVGGAPGGDRPGAADGTGPMDPSWLTKPLREARREASAAFERHYLSALLRETHGSVGETARRAGVSPRALFERMKQLDLRKEDFKPGRD